METAYQANGENCLNWKCTTLRNSRACYRSPFCVWANEDFAVGSRGVHPTTVQDFWLSTFPSPERVRTTVSYSVVRSMFPPRFLFALLFFYEALADVSRKVKRFLPSSKSSSLPVFLYGYINNEHYSHLIPGKRTVAIVSVTRILVYVCWMYT